MNDSDLLKRILIFDDDADLRRLLLTYLGKMFVGVELVEYDPLTQGVPAANFDWSRYDVLILDYYLCIHGVTGLDILQSNRKTPGFPATIMLTGAGNEEVAMRALKAGVYDYLRKQSLDKLELRNSILTAFEKHKQEKKRLNEQTQHGAAFNKALFYQQLEYKKDDPEFKNRVLFLIELDDHVAIEERAGMILRDNIIRHIARQSYEVFKLGECNPIVIRLGEYSIALLIDAPSSRKTLDHNIAGLINHLEKRPYIFGDQKYRFTVSVGVVVLPGQGQPADQIIEYARSACQSAALATDHSYHIYSESSPAVVPQTPTVAVVTDSVPELSQEPVPVPPEIIKTDTPEAEDSTLPEQTPVTDDSNLIQVPTVKSTSVESRPPAPQSEPTFDLEPTEKAATAPPVAPLPADPKSASPMISSPATVGKQGVKAVPVVARSPVSAPATPTNTRPKKTLAELKAEAAMPKAVPAKPAPTAPSPASIDNQELDITALDVAGRMLKSAFDEKRVIQVFQPIISLQNEDMDSDDEIHKVDLQLIEKDGTIRTAAEIKSQITQPAFRKFVDRWLLREVIGRLTNSGKNQYSFIVDISDASLADAGFFNWLRKLLTGLDSRNPGRFIVLEIDAKHLSSLEKQASALITYLRKTHDFKFLLGNIDTAAEVVEYAGRINFDLIRCKHGLIQQLHDTTANSPEQAADSKNSGKSQLEMIKSEGGRFIADDIEDATMLTEVISLGAEYAMGHFIGEPASQLDDVTNIETFEIV